MNTGSWEQLIETLMIGHRSWNRRRQQYVIQPCPPRPVPVAALDAFEQHHQFRLPKSYRGFCQTFGPGELSESFVIAVPCGKSSTSDIYRLNALYHAREYDEYSPDPEQHSRAIFFASDCATASYFWDPEDVTDREDPEHGVYVCFRDWTTERIADSFWEFVTDCILGPGHVKLYDDPPELLFEPL